MTPSNSRVGSFELPATQVACHPQFYEMNQTIIHARRVKADANVKLFDTLASCVLARPLVESLSRHAVAARAGERIASSTDQTPVRAGFALWSTDGCASALACAGLERRDWRTMRSYHHSAGGIESFRVVSTISSRSSTTFVRSGELGASTRQ